jgi:hypothetical protein
MPLFAKAWSAFFLLKEKLKLSFPLAAGAQETVTLRSK